MGTGIVSILLHNLPYNAKWLYWASVGIYSLNVALFLTFFTISVLRYILWPQIWIVMMRHPAQSLFLGTFPMGLATIINMTVFVCVPAWGYRAVQLVCATYYAPAKQISNRIGLGIMVDRYGNITCLRSLRPHGNASIHNAQYFVSLY
jgi:tellurite resistance protein TehA-like permease